MMRFTFLTLVVCLSANAITCGGSLAIYLSQIGGPNRLNFEEERELADQIELGNSKALHELITRNLPLVVHIARSYQGRGMSLEDLIGEGNLGLVRGAKRFRSRFNTKFATYASWWIKEAIRHAFLYTQREIRIPQYLAQKMAKVKKAKRALAALKGGMEPTFDEILVFLGLSLSPVAKDLLERALQITANEQGRFEDSGDEITEFVDTHDTTHSLEDDVEAAVHAMGNLNEQEQEILHLRYPLGEDEPLTLKEVGARLGISGDWARTLEKRALNRLGGAS